MNLRPLVLLLLLGAIAPRPLAAFDFTLQREHGTTDAVGVERTYVIDGPRKIYLNLPRDWRAMGTATALTLIPEAPPGASARFEAFPGDNGDKPPGFDDANRSTLRQQAASLLPGGAQDVGFLGDEQNPLVLYGWTSYEVTHGYSFYGQSYTQSTLFLKVGPRRLLRVTVSAPRVDFPKVYPPVRATLLSWFEQDLSQMAPDGSQTIKGN